MLKTIVKVRPAKIVEEQKEGGSDASEESLVLGENTKKKRPGRRSRADKHSKRNGKSVVKIQEFVAKEKPETKGSAQEEGDKLAFRAGDKIARTLNRKADRAVNKENVEGERSVEDAEKDSEQTKKATEGVGSKVMNLVQQDLGKEYVNVGTR